MADDGERPPSFLNHGAFTVLVFVVAVVGLMTTSDLDLGGPPLAAFAIGFSIFVAFYYVSMWVGWLFLQ